MAPAGRAAASESSLVGSGWLVALGGRSQSTTPRRLSLSEVSVPVLSKKHVYLAPLRRSYVDLARVGDAEGLGAEDALAEERDERVVDGVAELERQLGRDDVGDDHDAVQQQLPVVARGVAAADDVDVDGGADGEEEEEEDEEEGLAVVGGDAGGGEEHRADHVALRGVEAGADDVGETAMVHRSRDGRQRRGEGGRGLVENQLRAAVDHVALVAVVLRGDVQQTALGLLRPDLREADFRLGNRLAGQHGLVDDAAAFEQQTVAGSRYRGSAGERRETPTRRRRRIAGAACGCRDSRCRREPGGCSARTATCAGSEGEKRRLRRGTRGWARTPCASSEGSPCSGCAASPASTPSAPASPA